MGPKTIYLYPLILLVYYVITGSCGVLSSTASYDTVVVGLGAAGATAASELAQAGRRVLALEAQHRVGGRVHSHPFGNGLVELGAEWIHGTKDSRTYNTAVSNNIDLVSQKFSTQYFWSNGSINSYSNVLDELVEYAFAVQDEAEKPEPLGEFITRKLLSYIGEKHPQLLEDKEFIKEFLLLLNQFVNSYEASNDWNDVNVLSKYLDLEGDQHMSWHSHGYKTFFDLILNTFKNGTGYPTLTIKLNTEVTNIKWPQTGNEKVLVTTKNGDQYTADNVIVTVSVGVLKERHETLFTPSLPEEKVTAINTIPLGVVDKIILSFEHPWWHDPMSFSFLWTAEDKKSVSNEDYWTTNVSLLHKPRSTDNVITLWATGDVAKLIETLPEDVVKTKSMALLRRFLGKSYNITEPSGFVRTKWYSNQFTRGSYTYDNHAVAAHPSVRAELAAPLKDAAGQPRVLFAGEATNDIHFSTVHGASETGYREAMRLLPSS